MKGATEALAQRVVVASDWGLNALTAPDEEMARYEDIDFSMYGGVGDDPNNIGLSPQNPAQRTHQNHNVVDLYLNKTKIDTNTKKRLVQLRKTTATLANNPSGAGGDTLDDILQGFEEPVPKLRSPWFPGELLWAD